MERQILYYYQRGVASYLIAKKLGISNTKVRTLLAKKGIKVRGHNITNKVSAQRRTPAENKAITQKATEANIGSTHTNLHRVRLAAARQKNPTIDPVYEAPLVEECKKRNILVIPQKSFYKYNVDLYIPEKNVVIEIFGGNFHNKPYAVELFQNKLEYLSSKNVPVVVVWADKLNYWPDRVLTVALKAKAPLTIIDGSGAASTKGQSSMMSR